MNVIVIVADSLRRDHLGCCGNWTPPGKIARYQPLL